EAGGERVAEVGLAEKLRASADEPAPRATCHRTGLVGVVGIARKTGEAVRERGAAARERHELVAVRRRNRRGGAKRQRRIAAERDDVVELPTLRVGLGD